MENVKQLQKIDDILNSEGTILGLHIYNDKLYFSSYLTDKSGTVYYSVDESILTQYFNNQLRLQEVFLASENTTVPQNFNYLAKEQLAALIACGERLFLENPEGMRSDMLAGQFTNRHRHNTISIL